MRWEGSGQKAVGCGAERGTWRAGVRRGATLCATKGRGRGGVSRSSLARPASLHHLVQQRPARCHASAAPSLRVSLRVAERRVWGRDDGRLEAESVRWWVVHLCVHRINGVLPCLRCVESSTARDLNDRGHSAARRRRPSTDVGLDEGSGSPPSHGATHRRTGHRRLHSLTGRCQRTVEAVEAHQQSLTHRPPIRRAGERTVRGGGWTTAAGGGV